MPVSSMSNNGGEASDSGDRRSAVRAYARRLCEILQDHIGVITQSGDPMSQRYQAATLKQHDPREHTDWSTTQSSLEQGRGPSGPGGNRVNRVGTGDRRTETSREMAHGRVSEAAPDRCSSRFRQVVSAGVVRTSDGAMIFLMMTVWPESERLAEWRALGDLRWPRCWTRRSSKYFPLGGTRAHQEPRHHLSPTLLRRVAKSRDGWCCWSTVSTRYPAAHDNLVKTLAKWKGGFALTSRPGHGERRVVLTTTCGNRTSCRN